MRMLIAAASAAALLGGCTTEETQPVSAAQTRGQQCFRPQEVNGFNAEDDDKVLVTAGVNRVFELQIVGVCPDIDWSQRIGVRSRGGGSWVCNGFDAELLVPSPTGLQRCPVTGVRRLSDEEVRARREARSRR